MDGSSVAMVQIRGTKLWSQFEPWTFLALYRALSFLFLVFSLIFCVRMGPLALLSVKLYAELRYNSYSVRGFPAIRKSVKNLLFFALCMITQ